VDHFREEPACRGEGILGLNSGRYVTCFQSASFVVVNWLL
jgi:hypothetical protein